MTPQLDASPSDGTRLITGPKIPGPRPPSRRMVGTPKAPSSSTPCDARRQPLPRSPGPSGQCRTATGRAPRRQAHRARVGTASLRYFPTPARRTVVEATYRFAPRRHDCYTVRSAGSPKLLRGLKRLLTPIDQLQGEPPPVTDLHFTQLDQLVDPLRGHKTPWSQRVEPEHDALNHVRSLDTANTNPHRRRPQTRATPTPRPGRRTPARRRRRCGSVRWAWVRRGPPSPPLNHPYGCLAVRSRA